VVNASDASALGESGRHDDLAERAGGAGHDNNLSFHDGISRAGQIFAVHYGHAKSVGNAAKTLRHKHVFAKKR
jgi:hypothetical protein